MALLLILFYSIPAQCIGSLWPLRRTHASRWSGKRTHFCEPHDTISATHATLLPHPPTDTTETSEETEVSEMTDEHSDDDETQVVRPARPLLRPTMKYVADTPPLLRLAKISEGPYPTMQCALKLKHKLLRQSLVSSGGRSDASGSQASSRQKARRRSTAVPAVPALPPLSTPPTIPARGRSHRRTSPAPSASPPPMPAPLLPRRVVSLDASARKSLRDTRLLERLLERLSHRDP
jgi:hypothetical protein